MTKIRLSNHHLMIEKGRYTNIDRKNRVCPFCPKDIEDEIHFITTCPSYAHNRKSLFAALGLQNAVLNSPKPCLFEFLMTNEKAVPQTAKFISKSSYIREFLLCHHRNDN